MAKIKNFATRVQTGIMMRMAGVPAETKTERGDHLLEVLGTIIIAVVLLILFKDAIVNIFQKALNNTTTSVDNLFTKVTG